MNTNLKLNKSILLSIFLAIVFLGFTDFVFAYSGNGGNGCYGDETCRAERQANGGGYGRSNGGGHHGNSEARKVELDNLANSPLLPITENDKKTLEQMREEEKLARDVYITMYQKWSEITFDNISKSEERHKEAVVVLIKKYGLTDPITNDEVGIFTSETLQKLYNDLVAKGNKSLVDALEVGATIEDLDIYDLERFMDETENADIIKVYTNLRNGSENHMRAFTGQLKNNKGSYSAQYITDTRLQEILEKNNLNQKQNNSLVIKNNIAKKESKTGFFTRLWRLFIFWK